MLFRNRVGRLRHRLRPQTDRKEGVASRRSQNQIINIKTWPVYYVAPPLEVEHDSVRLTILKELNILICTFIRYTHASRQNLSLSLPFKRNPRRPNQLCSVLSGRKSHPASLAIAPHTAAILQYLARPRPTAHATWQLHAHPRPSTSVPARRCTATTPPLMPGALTHLKPSQAIASLQQAAQEAPNGEI